MAPSPQRHAEAQEDAVVLELQELLLRYGYLTRAQVDTGPGLLGPKTRAALELVLEGAPPASSPRSPPPTAPTRLTPTTHVVRAGDTLSQLAVHYDVSLKALAELNHIKDIRLLWVGQKLTLPKAAPPPTTYTPHEPEEPSPVTSSPPAASGKTHSGTKTPEHEDAPPPPSVTPRAEGKLRVDFTFITSCEGGRVLHGYVPDAEHSQSGVTIATGFDLGCRDLASLRQLGLSPTLCAKLSKYLGKKQNDAKRLLTATPLTVTQAEAEAIDVASKKSALQTLVQRYNRAVAHRTGLVPFEKLPGEAQTVIASVSFQYGDLGTRAPKFWKTVTEQQWKAAVKELRDFGDRYDSRHEKEADLLARIGTARSTPTPPTKPTTPKPVVRASGGGSATPQETSDFCFPFSSLPAKSWNTGARAFGSNRSKGKRKHAGCDLYFPMGTWIHAVADGEVITQPYNFYCGTQALEIRHGTLVVRYGEIKPNSFVGGTRVKRGQRLCQVGHLVGIDVESDMLHLEIYAGTAQGPLTVKGNVYVRRKDVQDPGPYLDLWSKNLPPP